VVAAVDLIVQPDDLNRLWSPRVLDGTADGPRASVGCELSHVTAQSTEDPADPLVTLRDLPEREHAEFLRQYHQAVDAAHDPVGYQRLRRLLHLWSLSAVAAGQPVTTRSSRPYAPERLRR
jgi:hypothetical protein